MKVILLTTATCLAFCSCDAGPQRTGRTDSTRVAHSPATKRLPADSPADTKMPVVRTDTARQADMPVVKPPKNIQPK